MTLPAGWMPTIEAYMALARAMHENDDVCNASYMTPFEDCAYREYDIQDAVKVLVDLHADGWRLAPDPLGTAELGL